MRHLPILQRSMFGPSYCILSVSLLNIRFYVTHPSCASVILRQPCSSLSQLLSWLFVLISPPIKIQTDGNRFCDFIQLRLEVDLHFLSVGFLLCVIIPRAKPLKFFLELIIYFIFRFSFSFETVSHLYIGKGSIMEFVVYASGSWFHRYGAHLWDSLCLKNQIITVNLFLTQKSIKSSPAGC